MPPGSSSGATSSQTLAVLLQIRERILSGALGGGDRLVEQALVRELGASRTPVRAALARLEHEGLVQARPGGGYVVRSFELRDVLDALQVRGALEGLAARFAAEHGLARRQREALRRCADELDDVVADLTDGRAAFDRYVALNEEFHAALVAAADNSALTAALGQVMALPFASPSAFVQAQAELPESLRVLVSAQEQHRALLDAIVAGQGDRAELLAREHALLAERNLEHVLKQSRRALRAVPGFSLIRDRALADGSRLRDRPAPAAQSGS